MSTIGIKLADGSFYPILEEGKPSSKTLDITPANDNQTTVLVDLYRSDNSKMENAEYVDTLRIEVAPHRAAEKALSFTVSLDENNRISAKLHDPESGGTSNTTFESRTPIERMTQKDDADTLTVSAQNENNTNDTLKGLALLDDGIVQKGIDGTQDEHIQDANEDSPSEAMAVAAAASGAALESAAALDSAIADAKDDEPVALDAYESSDYGESFKSGDYTLEENSENAIDFDDMVMATEADGNESNTGYEAGTDSSQAKALDISSDIDLSDLDLPDIETSAPIDGADALVDNTDTIADDADVHIDDAGAPIDSKDAPTGSADAANASIDGNDSAKPSDFEMDNGAPKNSLPELDDLDFDLPDMPSHGGKSSENNTSLDDLDFDLPDFGPSDFTANDKTDDSDVSSMENLSLDDLLDDESSAAPSVYNEDADGKDGDAKDEDEEDGKKRRSVAIPMIICAACAVICLLATGLGAFIFLKGQWKDIGFTKASQASESTGEVVSEDSATDVAGGGEQNRDAGTENKAGAASKVTVKSAAKDSGNAAQGNAEGNEANELKEVPPLANANAQGNKAAPEKAAEDAIVVASVPVKEVVPVSTASKKPDIKHTVQWGDTLWDISQSYYKTPWRYKYIARYNNIKDPDYILSGTVILIPAQ